MPRLRALFSVLIIAAVTLALLEASLRVRQLWKYGSFRPTVSEFVTDPETGLRILKPGYRGQGLSINSLGFRGPEIETPKPPGRIRLAFLGGSTTTLVQISFLS